MGQILLCLLPRCGILFYLMQTNLQRVHFAAVQAPDGQSMRLDLSLPDYMARVTVGHLDTETRYCDTEVLNIETEERIHWQHQEFGSAAELNAALTDFFYGLRDLPEVTASASVTDQNIRLDTLLQPLLAAAAGH